MFPCEKRINFLKSNYANSLIPMLESQMGVQQITLNRKALLDSF